MGVFWLIAAVLFAVIDLDAGGVSAIIAVAVLLGGCTTSALAYLLTERIFRPVTARALAGNPPTRPTRPVD